MLYAMSKLISALPQNNNL